MHTNLLILFGAIYALICWILIANIHLSVEIRAEKHVWLFIAGFINMMALTVTIISREPAMSLNRFLTIATLTTAPIIGLFIAWVFRQPSIGSRGS